MQIIYGIQHIKKFKNPVVAMGVFDGVHRAHQKILRAAASKAKSIGGTSIVLTFWPHPQQEDAICSLGHRLHLISLLGIDIAVVIQFNQSFSRITAQNFLRKIILKKLAPSYIFVGENFRFGKNGQGNLIMLKHFTEQYGFTAIPFRMMKIGGRIISSSRIRGLIMTGNLRSAKALLGRPVSVLGTVIHGSAIGRTIGVATANINPHHEVLPPSGIYAAIVRRKNNSLNGVCYIGRKPTFAKQGSPERRVIEVHIFDFHKNIYGEDIEISFLSKVRNDSAFASLEDLSKQIKKDIYKVRKLFPSPKPSHNI